MDRNQIALEVMLVLLPLQDKDDLNWSPDIAVKAVAAFSFKLADAFLAEAGK